MPVEIKKVLSQENIEALRDHLKETYLDGGLLSPDFSSYAKGRMRCWLHTEWSLKERKFVEGAHQDQKLWDWIHTVWPQAEIGLVTYSPVGITAHRDDSYADYMAVAINLGEIEGWGYWPHREGWGAGPQKRQEKVILTPPVGAVMAFNCKDPHWVINPAEDRWAINLWTINPKFRSMWDRFQEERTDV